MQTTTSLLSTISRAPKFIPVSQRIESDKLQALLLKAFAIDSDKTWTLILEMSAQHCAQQNQ